MGKTIFHIIDNLKRGGAETLLLEVVKSLKDHKNYIITLTGENDFKGHEIEGLQIIPLGFNSFFSMPRVIFKLKKLIARYQADLIHAHLPLSSLVARIATPKSIKLFISVHNTLSQSLQKVSPKLFTLEKKLHSGRENLVFVSAAIKEDYQKIAGIKGRSFVLYNFIANKFFESRQNVDKHGIPEKLKFVSIGSFKHQKNFDTLVKAFNLLDPEKFSLDIYGDGPEREKLEQLLKQYQLKHVKLKGSAADIDKVLIAYDAFILASRYEGFGLAPLEAAAVGLPLLLSEIDVFKEVTKGYATYFSAEDEQEIAFKLQTFKANYEAACAQAAAFAPLVKENYSQDNYIRKLLNIYNT